MKFGAERVLSVTTNQKLLQFDEVLSNVLTSLSAYDCVFIDGDFNLNSLSTNNHGVNSVPIINFYQGLCVYKPYIK